MKQLFIILCVTLGVTAFAQDKPAEVKPNPNAPKIKFAQEAFDFGTDFETGLARKRHEKTGGPR